MERPAISIANLAQTHWREAERADFVKMTDSEQQNLTSKGLTFNKPETKPFRVELAKAGFYQDIRKTAGEPGWALLEKYVGQLG